MPLIFISITLFFIAPVHCYQCYIPGKCLTAPNGHYATIRENTVEECISNCFKSPRCIWSTFDGNSNYCYLFQFSCTEISTEDCSECYSNEKKCISESKFVN